MVHMFVTFDCLQSILISINHLLIKKVSFAFEFHQTALLIADVISFLGLKIAGRTFAFPSYYASSLFDFGLSHFAPRPVGQGSSALNSEKRWPSPVLGSD